MLGQASDLRSCLLSQAWNGATHYFNAVIKPKDARAQHQQLMTMKVAQRSQKLSVSEVSPTAPADRKAK